MRRLAPVLVLCALALVPASAAASPGSGPAAVVSMGDSYISGEAGRWQGNSLSPTPGNDGTDRACQPAGPGCQVDKSRVYVDGTAADGCHRSDVAEVLSAKFPDAQGVNIACSGGVAKNLYRSSNGGEGQNGEPAQGDLLTTVAKEKDVKLIIVSVGGNDLGFASIIAACLQAYESRSGPCNPSQQAKVEQKLPTAIAAVEKSFDEIRAVMADAGYSQGQYRLVAQTYPSVVTRASETRYAENDPQRTSAGCPFYDADLDWARTKAGPEIGGAVKTAAAARGIETLELIDLLAGHEICAKTTSQVTPTNPPSATGSEWGRLLGGTTVQQGDLQEAFHPNAFAQAALGTCLQQVYSAAPGAFNCTAGAGKAPGSARVVRTGAAETTATLAAAASKRALKLTVRRVKARRRGQACYAFNVTAGGRRVVKSLVRFAGHYKRTGKVGRATLCTAKRPATQSARATRKGYVKTARTVHVPRR